MSEAQDIKTQITINNAKISAMRLYGEQFEKSLHTLAESLAQQGYTNAEIAEALDATLPTFKAGLVQVEADIDLAVKAMADG